MPPFDIVPGLAKRDASGQLLPAGAVTGFTGPDGNPTDVIARNTIGNLKDELPASLGLSKASGETLKFPIEDANPAYQARVSFRMFSLQPTKPGTTQKILEKQTEDNLKNQNAASSEDVAGANNAGPITKASTQEIDDDETLEVLERGLDKTGAVATGGTPDEKKGSTVLKFLKDKLKNDQVDQLLSVINTGLTFQPVKDEPIVDMYFPLTMQFNDNAQYDNANIGGIGASIEAAVTAGAGALEATLASIDTAATEIFDLITGNERLGETAARLSAARLIKTLPAGISNALTLTNRAIINPNTRAIFRGVSLREFTFQFKMIAESQQEAAVVEKIVRHFRKELYPGTYQLPVGVEGVNADLGFKFPNVFEIIFKYKGGKNDKLPRLHHCYLRNVSYTVHPTGGTFRRDGQPNEIDLTLSFVERKTLNKQDVKDGY